MWTEFPNRKQLHEVARLSGMWGVFQTLQEAVDDLIRTNYLLWERDPIKYQSVILSPEVLKQAEKESERLEGTKRDISTKLQALAAGQWSGSANSRGQLPNPYVLVRDLWIRLLRDRGDKAICRQLDLELAAPEGRTPIGFPEGWVNKFHVKTYLEAYEHRNCRRLLQKMIATAKKGRLLIWV
jgi:hypothetical protein